VGMGDLLTQVELRTLWFKSFQTTRSTTSSISNNRSRFIPSGVEFKNQISPKVAERWGEGIRIEGSEDVREGLAEALAYKMGGSALSMPW